MDLRALPPEILSRVYRSIDLGQARHWGDVYSNQDFKCLRFTCREIYDNTTYDAGIRYGWDLQHLDMLLTYESLALLLHICTMPPFRDKIEVISLQHPGTKCCDHHKYINYAWCEYEAHLKDEASEGFIDSNEAVCLLATCFQELGKSHPLLQKIKVRSKEAKPRVFTAPELAQVSLNVVNIEIDLRPLRGDSDTRFFKPVSQSSRFIKAIKFAAEVHAFVRDNKNWRKEDMVHNKLGRHYTGYRPSRPDLPNLATRLTEVEQRAIEGCAHYPRLRQCHGWDNLFVNIFANQTYYHLTSLNIRNSYSSGSRLRGFIKRHAATLQRVTVYMVFLTDSS
jgi:hypothetical protein